MSRQARQSRSGSRGDNDRHLLARDRECRRSAYEDRERRPDRAVRRDRSRASGADSVLSKRGCTCNAVTQARPDLAVARAPGLKRGRLQVTVNAGAAQAPDPAYPRGTVALARGDRDDSARRFTLRRPKGWRASIFAIFSERRSLSMAISPPWRAACRSPRHAHRAGDASGCWHRLQETRRARRSHPPPGPQATERPTRHPHHAGLAEPLPAHGSPSVSVAAPEPDPLQYVTSPRLRLRHA